MHHVLMLTHSGDSYVTDRVAAGLDRRGLRPLRVDTDRVPAEASLSVGLAGAEVWHELAGVSAGRLRAVWLRRLRPAAPPGELDPVLRAGAQAEIAATWDAWLDALHPLRVIDLPAVADRVEGHKLHQLRAAQAAGLAVPPTLITSDAGHARRFFAEQGGDVVVKMLTPLTISMDGQSPFVHTQRLRPEHLEHLDELAVSPMCFQRRISSLRELRVVWVDGRAFVGAMAGGDDPDWRTGSRGGWLDADLDADTDAALTRLMRGFGLLYGAIDLIVPPTGPPVFLEVNPHGEWGMLERDLGLPIGDAIAAALAQ